MAADELGYVVNDLARSMMYWPRNFTDTWPSCGYL